MRSTLHLPAVGLVALLALGATGCGTVGSSAPGSSIGSTPTTARPDDPPTTSPGSGDHDHTAPTSPTTSVPADRGWIGGEPDWSGSDAAAGDETMTASAEYAAEEPATDRDIATSSAEPVSDAPADPVATPLRAGSVDDNEQYDEYLAYLARIGELGIALRPFDPAGRIVVEVTGADGRPRAGVPVTIAGTGGDIASLTTTADGTIRFLPAVYGQPTDGTFSFRVGDVTVDAAAGTSAELVTPDPGGADVVALDVLFLLDATGSMGDEIDRLKQSIDSVAARVDALEGTADVRFAMTLYRDQNDVFLTSTFDFTDDVDAFRAALADVVADGGGDYPEALDEGLAEALAVPAWRSPDAAVQLVFLVADAPPQIGRTVDAPYTDSMRVAGERGVKVFPIASSESDDQAEAVFRQLAQATGARFVFLSYGAGGAATGANTDIDVTDYEELALDDLVVRLIAEEVAALIGDGGVVPPPTPTTTTVPDGQ